MLVAFIPYLTALMGNFGVSLPVVIFYGLSLTMTGLIHNFLWLYVAYKYITHERQFIGMKFVKRLFGVLAILFYTLLLQD